MPSVPIIALAAAVLLLSPCAASAQAWPSRPVTMMVPFPAGGTADLLARGTAQALSDALGQPFRDGEAQKELEMGCFPVRPRCARRERPCGNRTAKSASASQTRRSVEYSAPGAHLICCLKSGIERAPGIFILSNSVAVAAAVLPPAIRCPQWLQQRTSHSGLINVRFVPRADLSRCNNERKKVASIRSPRRRALARSPAPQCRAPSRSSD